MIDIGIVGCIGFVLGFACCYISMRRGSDHAALGALAAAVLSEQSGAP